MKNAWASVKARAIVPAMAKSDPDALAAALRANLRRRKGQASGAAPALASEPAPEPPPRNTPPAADRAR
jgi:hypothetical protein